MPDIDPWMAGRMGGTGRDDQETYKVRDIRPPLEKPRRGRRAAKEISGWPDDAVQPGARVARKPTKSAQRKVSRRRRPLNAVRMAWSRRQFTAMSVLSTIIAVAAIASLVVLSGSWIGLW